MITAVTASGVGYETDIGYVGYVDFRTYQSSDADPPAAVVNRFVADGCDGELRLTATAPLRLGIRHLSVFRRGTHGSATYWHRTRHWVTVATEPPPDLPPWTLHTFTPTGNDPNTVVVPFTLLHCALLEFLTTGQRPTTVRWQAVPLPSA